MSEFLLIAPNDWAEIDRNIILSVFSVEQIKEYSGPRASAVYEVTEALRNLNVISETVEVEAIKYIQDLDQIWIKFTGV
jgi:hypothetical protein